MRDLRLTFCSLIVFALTAAQTAPAAEIKQRDGDSADVTAIELKGRLERGDLLTLQALISKLPTSKTMAIYLDSTGGSLQEGIALGRFFYDAKIRTIIPARVGCLAFCAAAFLGGRDATTGKPWRLKTSSAGFGFTGFVSGTPEKPEYTDKDMSSAVAEAQRTILQLADYIQAIHEDLAFLRLMLKPAEGPRKINFVTNEEALQLGIYVLDEKSGEIIDPKVIVERVK